MPELSGALPVADRRTVVRRAAALVRQFRGRLAAILLVHTAAVLCGLVPPVVLGTIVDRIIAGRSLDLPGLVALIAAALVVGAVLAFIAADWAFALGERIFALLRTEFSAGLLDMPIREIEAVDPGEVLSRSTSDMDAIEEVARTGVPETLVGAVTVVATLVAAFVLNPLVALGCLAGLPFIVFSTRWYVRRATAVYAEQLSTRATVAGDTAETVRGHDVVEAYGLGPVRERVMRRGVARALEAAGVPVRLEQRWFPLVQIGYHLPLLVVLAWGAHLTRSGYAGIGTVAAVALYMRSIQQPLDDLIYWFGESQSAVAAMGRILGVTAVSRTTAEVPATADPGNAVELDGVSFAYGTSGDALTAVDLNVRTGERVCLVGASGAGKTTLALLLAGVLTPRSGQVRVTGRIALVAQEDHVFHGTVRDNLTLARPEASDGELWPALAGAGADGWVRELDGGLDTALGGDAYEPTPAQARQLALARLFLNRPAVLLLDEATAGLSGSESRHFESALATVMRDSTVIQIAHDLWAAEPADRVIMMSDGRIAESGSHAELLARDGAYARLYSAWRAGAMSS